MKKILILGLLIALCIVVSPALADTSLVLSTDKADYAPWETVNILGTGFTPGATVSITVEWPAPYGFVDQVLPPAVADAAGTFTAGYSLTNGPNGYGLEGTYIVIATDSVTGGGATTTFTDAAQVDTTTTLNPITTPLTVGQTGVSFSGTVAPVKTGDPNVPDLVNVGLWIGSPGGTITLIKTVTTTGGNGAFSGTFDTPPTPGTYTLQAHFVGTNDGGKEGYHWKASDSDTRVVIVNSVPTNTVPVVTVNPVGSAINEGGTFTGSGSFTDPDADTWTATVDYGDGSSVQSLPLTGKTFTLNHVYADDGTFTVSVVVNDGDVSGSSTVDVTVNNVAPAPAIGAAPIMSPEGTIISLTASATDTSPVDTAAGFTYAWSVTMNGASYGMGGSGASFTFTPDDNGAYIVTLTTTDKDGGRGTATASITVTNVAPTASIDGTIPTSSPEGTPITLSGSATDPSTVDMASIIYAWSVTKNGRAFDSGTGTSFTFTPDDNAVYIATLTVTDKDGGIDSDSTGDITVTNVAPTPLISGAPTSSIPEGTAISLRGSATDPSPIDTTEGIVCTWSVAKNGVPYACSGSATSCSFTPDDNGVYAATLKACDKDNGEGTITASITVTNVAPAVGAITIPVDPVKVGTSFTATVPYTDPGTADTHTVLWTWGDGPTSPGAASGGTASGIHSYTAPGIYTVSVTVTDDDGGIGTATASTYIVIYDPSGGFVTGGGWINSPQGAYKADPAMTGKANFGFVSKYKKGATVPEGETEFQFKAGNLNFHSTEYQWLVVAGAKAMFKGVGTVNGAGNYAFLVSAIDKSPDQFRIKIWEASSTDAVIYDNQITPDKTDNADPTTVIAGGSIVIH